MRIETQAFALLLVVWVSPGLVCGSEQEEQLSVLAGRMFASLSAWGIFPGEWCARQDLQ
jgi:hypothetical protein